MCLCARTYTHTHTHAHTRVWNRQSAKPKSTLTTWHDLPGLGRPLAARNNLSRGLRLDIFRGLLFRKFFREDVGGSSASSIPRPCLGLRTHAGIDFRVFRILCGTFTAGYEVLDRFVLCTL